MDCRSGCIADRGTECTRRRLSLHMMEKPMTTPISSPSKPMSDVDAQIDCESAMRSVVENQMLAYAEDPDPADDPAF